MTTKFRIARVLRGIKQVELSFETKIPLSTLSMIECGWRNPNPTELEKLRKALPRLEEGSNLLKEN